MADGKRIDPYGQFNFIIEIDGVLVGGFSEASGLTTDTNMIDTARATSRMALRASCPG